MLIKIVILIVTISISFAYDKEGVNRVFENLMKQKFNDIEIDILANPFQKVDINLSKNLHNNLNKSEVPKQEKIIPKLQAIFNDRVKLEDKWYKVGDEVLGFRVIGIDFDMVILKDRDGEVNLSLVENKEVVRKLNVVK